MGVFNVGNNNISPGDSGVLGPATHLDILGRGGLKSFYSDNTIAFNQSTFKIYNTSTNDIYNIAKMTVGTIVYLSDGKYYQCYGHEGVGSDALFREINLTGDNNTLQGSSTFSAGILVTNSIKLTNNGTNIVTFTNDTNGLFIDGYLNTPGINIINADYGIKQNGDAIFNTLTGSLFDFTQFTDTNGTNPNISNNFSINNDLYVGGGFTCSSYSDWVTNTISTAINAISDDIYLGNYDFNGYDFAIDGYTISNYNDATDKLTINSHIFSGGHFKGDIFEFIEDGVTNPTLYPDGGKLKTNTYFVADGINIGGGGVTNTGPTTLTTLTGTGFNFTNFNGITTNITNDFKIGDNLIVVGDITASSITGSRVQATVISASTYEGISLQNFDLGATFSAGLLVTNSTDLVMDEGHIVTKFNGNEYVLNNYILTNDGAELIYNNVIIATTIGFKVGFNTDGYENCAFSVDDGGDMYVNDIYANRNNTIQYFNSISAGNDYAHQIGHLEFDRDNINDSVVGYTLIDLNGGNPHAYMDRYYLGASNYLTNNVYGPIFNIGDEENLQILSQGQDNKVGLLFSNGVQYDAVRFGHDLNETTTTTTFSITTLNTFKIDAGATVIPNKLVIGGQIGTDNGFYFEGNFLKTNEYNDAIIQNDGGSINFYGSQGYISYISSSDYIESREVTASTISGSNYELGQSDETGSLNNNRIYFEGGTLYAQTVSGTNFEGIVETDLGDYSFNNTNIEYNDVAFIMGNGIDQVSIAVESLAASSKINSPQVWSNIFGTGTNTSNSDVLINGSNIIFSGSLTNNQNKFDVTNGIVKFTELKNIAESFTVNTTGDLECNSLKETSLRQYKHAIMDIQSSQLQKIKLLRPVTFIYNTDIAEDINDPATRQAGFIAEQMQTVYPEICWYHDEKLAGVQYQRLTSYLTKGIQQLDEQNRMLKQRVNSLQQRLEKLQKLLMK